MSSVSSCQCNEYKSLERYNALFLSERLSDLTIIFPSHNISLPAHRLMMANTSPYFENLFYGPMAMKNQEWKVIDSDPEIFKIILAHCYDLNLLKETFETILPVYKLADCYLIDSLKSQCLKLIRNIISKDTTCSKWDYPHILEWSKDYGFNDMKFEVLDGLSTIINKYEKSDIRDALPGNFSSLLLNIPFETRKELLNLCKKIDILKCKESWRNPTNPLSSEVLMSIFESSSCNYELSHLQGCFSPQIFNSIIITNNPSQIVKNIDVDDFYFSIIDNLHSKALFDSVKDLLLEDVWISLLLHITYNSMSPKDLAIWSSNYNLSIASLFLSDVEDQHVQWAIETIISIKPVVNLSFPRSSLSINGLKKIITSIDFTENSFDMIDICSCNIEVECQNELKSWVKGYNKKCEIEIFESDDEIHGW